MKAWILVKRSKNTSRLVFGRWLRAADRSSPPEVLLEKSVLKVCSKFTEEHPCRSVILIKLLCHFIEICSKFTEEHPCQSVILIKLLCNVFEIALRHGCSPVNLLHILRTPFYKNTCGGLLPIAAEYWKGLKDIGTFETSWVQKQPPEKFCKKRCF